MKSYVDQYLANLSVELSVASYTRVRDSWRDFDFVPDYNKFYFIREGTGWIRIGEDEYVPEPGQLYLLPSGLSQSYATTDPENPLEKYWCHFTANIGDLPFSRALELERFIRVTEEDWMQERFATLIESFYANTMTGRLRAKAILLELICYYVDHADVRLQWLTESGAFSKLDTVLKFIEAHLAEDVTVERLAKLVHFHPNYFIRFFKSLLGDSPLHYINRLRIERAKQRLSATNQSISEVADSLGMQPYYFSRMFKQHTGMSPSEYRGTMTDLLPRS